MFPLAQILKSKGFQVCGSDVNESYITEIEKKLGMEVHIGHDKKNVVGSDLVIYSAAISQDNEELLEAQKLNIKTVERAKLLGFLASEKENCVGVCGTHGKTSTTSLITHILLNLGKDPSAIIGGKLSEIGGNARVGSSDIMVCEACEYVDTFLNIHPKIAVVLNIDEDHMEYFKTLNNMINSYHNFCLNTSDIIIFNGDDLNVVKAVNGANVENKNINCDLKNKRQITFGLKDTNDYYADNINFSGYKNNKFDVYFNDKKIHKKNKIASLTLNIPGQHNVLNCLAAFVACLELGCDAVEIQSAVESFEGVGRRFEILGEYKKAVIADDYAHHPKEIEVTLKAAKTMNFKKIWVIFQPFTFSRTFLLLNDFAESLSLADEVVLAPIMGSREINTYNISSEDLAKKIEGSYVFKNFDEISDYVKNNVSPGDLVLTMGCGDIYKCAKKILN